MTYATPNRDGPSLKLPLVWSVALHLLLSTFVLLSGFRSAQGEVWSGPGGGAVTIGLAAGLSGVPLPRPEVVSRSRTVDATKGLYQSEPRTKPPDEEGTRLPEFEKSKRRISHPSKVLEDNTPPPSGAIPYGQGGTPSLPYTQFNMGTGTPGGMGFGGPGGDFGKRFPWYVEAVRKRISGNWLQSTVDPAIRFAPRVVVIFQILRDGTAANVQLTRGSGNASVDTSAIRAVRDSSPFERLPSEYSGGNVSVEFWFEFRR
jgi:protein TonB